MYGYFSMILRNSHRKVLILQWLFSTHYFEIGLTEISGFNKYIKVIDCKLEFDKIIESLYHLSFHRSYCMRL